LCLASLGFLGGKFWLADFDILAHSAPWFVQLVSPEKMFPGIQLMNGYGPRITAAMIEHAEHAAHTWALIVSLFVAGLGIFGAWWIYGAKKVNPQRIADGFGELYHTVRNKYFIDEIVDATVIRGSMSLGKILRWFDETIVDGMVLLVGRINRVIGDASAWFDLKIVDGAVNGVGALTQTFGFIARLFQTGRIQQYASFAVAGGLAVAAWLLLG
jgi:NADH-quinone oxidoreductase subunit L